MSLPRQSAREAKTTTREKVPTIGRSSARQENTKDKGKSKNKGGKGTYTTNNSSNSHEDLLAVARKLGVQLTGRTPDNKHICDRFNDGQGCDGRCQMLHICRIKGCHEKRPMVKHNGWAEAAAALNQ